MMSGPVMPWKRYEPEQIVNPLRKTEVEIANGKTTPNEFAHELLTSRDLMGLKTAENSPSNWY